MIVTIDGPTASGKSSVARALAKKLNIYYLATGMLYRAAAYVLIKQAGYAKKNLKNPKPEDLNVYLDPERFQYFYDSAQGEKILFDGQEVTPFLKGSDIDDASSILSANRLVRKALLDMQRSFAKKFDLVAEGRDVGSVVFPNADHKFFLTASVVVRAKRWQADQGRKGNSFSLDQAIEKISQRDERDKNREVAPLVKPSDATLIDNSDLDFQATLKRIFVSIVGPSKV